MGPAFNGVVGRAAGSLSGFNYSDVFKNLTWDKASLAEYLKDPQGQGAGHQEDDAKIADVIAYLAHFNTDGTKK